MADKPGFTGLSPQAGDFLAELGSNNNRDWGMGYFEASPATTATLRDHVGEHQPTFLSAMTAATSRHFTLEGDPYKRLPTIPPDTPQPRGRRSAL
ncbi:MAG: hypothetical protein FWC46_09655 [Actinomycetia bacterium]|nr:hypothetical protein [Actinomycetes bacterium]